MMNETKEQMKQEEVMDEELFKVQAERDLVNAERELSNAEQNLKEHEFVLDMMKKQLEAYKKAKDVIIEYCKPLEPVYEYETKDEYLEYLKVAQKLKVEQEMFKLEQQSIPSMEKTVEAKKESIESLKTKISKLKGD